MNGSQNQRALHRQMVRTLLANAKPTHEREPQEPHGDPVKSATSTAGMPEPPTVGASPSRSGRSVAEVVGFSKMARVIASVVRRL